MRAYINEKAFYTERIYRTIQLRSETRGLAGSGRTADSGQLKVVSLTVRHARGVFGKSSLKDDNSRYAGLKRKNPENSN